MQGNPPNGNNFMISSSKYITANAKKIKYENVINMKITPKLALRTCEPFTFSAKARFWK
jgi:hypothetical protein